MSNSAIIRRTRSVLGAVACAWMAVSVPSHAQTNNNDYTPLGSRIKRGREFPMDLPPRWNTAQMNKVNRDRSKAMVNQFSKCIYKRSNENALELLRKTDFGFSDFQQINLEQERALRIYGFKDCLSRVAGTHGTSVLLRFSPGGLRQWVLQEAYFDRYPEGPTWVKAGNAIGERTYPLSERDAGVLAAMDLADCVVQADPYSADYFYRAPSASEDEKSAIERLKSSLGPCLPEGQQVQLSLPALKVWLGEGLWHAANNSAPAPTSVASGGN